MTTDVCKWIPFVHLLALQIGLKSEKRLKLKAKSLFHMQTVRCYTWFHFRHHSVTRLLVLLCCSVFSEQIPLSLSLKTSVNFNFTCFHPFLRRCKPVMKSFPPTLHDTASLMPLLLTIYTSDPRQKVFFFNFLWKVNWQRSIRQCRKKIPLVTYC